MKTNLLAYKVPAASCRSRFTSNGMKMRNKYFLIIACAALVFFFISPSFSWASENATTTPDIIEPGEHATSTKSIIFYLRYQDELVFEGSWELEEPREVLIRDNVGVQHKATSTSVLAAFLAIDEAQDSFHVSDLAYFSSFDAFLINCVEIPARSLDACFNWQYVVNGIFPFVSTDKYILQDGDDVYLFFGTPHKTTIEKNEVEAGEEFSTQAQNYAYKTNLWEPLIGVTVGVTKKNPDDPFSPIVITSSPVNESGRASFIIETPGTYQVGISQDFYFPPAGLIVSPKAASSTPSQESSSNTGGGGGGGTVFPQVKKIDIEKAIQFLRDNQKKDGSIGSVSLYTDWTGIAFGAYGKNSGAKESLIQYLKTDPSPGTLLTDYERRAMALMALGISPHNGTKTNYVQSIIDGFDGEQFGTPDLVNDDIFALFPLLNAGVGKDDPMIVKAISFILSRQGSNGSWIGVDVTAAGIQALSKVSSLAGVSEALARAKEYLKNKQEENGGFEGNPFSTSWVIQAIKALREEETNWIKNGKTPGEYLSLAQSQDGGIGTGSLDSRIWATSYAIPAALSKTWYEILGTFEKPQAASPASGGGVGDSSQPLHYEQLSIPTNTTSTEEYIAPPVIAKPSSPVIAQAPSPSVIKTALEEKKEAISQTLPELFEEELSTPQGKIKVLNEKTEPKALLAYTGQSQIAGNIFTMGVIFSLLLGVYLIWRFFQYLIIR